MQFYRWNKTLAVFRIGDRYYSWLERIHAWNPVSTKAMLKDAPSCRLEIALLYPQVQGEPKSDTRGQT